MLYPNSLFLSSIYPCALKLSLWKESKLLFGYLYSFSFGLEALSGEFIYQGFFKYLCSRWLSYYLCSLSYNLSVFPLRIEVLLRSREILANLKSVSLITYQNNLLTQKSKSLTKFSRLSSCRTQLDLFLIGVMSILLRFLNFFSLQVRGLQVFGIQKPKLILF